MKTAPTVSATLAQATQHNPTDSDVTANAPEIAETLRPYAPSDAPTLALALGRALVREMNEITNVAPSVDDPFAGIATGKGDRQARFRKLDNVRSSLASVHASYNTRMEMHLRAIVAIQEDLRASLAESCAALGVSLPGIAATLGIKVAGDATIGELSAEAKAKANIARQLEETRAEAKREIAEAREAREMRLDQLHADKMRLDGYSEIEITLALKQRAEKRAAKVAAKAARK